MLSTITDDSCGMPSELRRCLKIRLSLGPWYLASVLFVNAYSGLVITSLTTPFELNSIDFVCNLTKLHYTEEKIISENLWNEPITYCRDTVLRGKLIVVKHKIHQRPFQKDSEFRILSSIYYKGYYKQSGSSFSIFKSRLFINW